MVLSLFESSLRSVIRGIENGRIRHPHLLPPILRKRILDTTIKQGFLSDHPNVLALLTSVEFLIGITSLTVQACYNRDSRFLEHLASSLATKLPNGKTVGAAIKKLNLILHERTDDHEPWSKDFSPEVYALVAQCPNTNSLDLRVANIDGDIREGYWPLNENRAFIRIMENLVELSLAYWTQLGTLCYISNFDRLTTLKLDHCSMPDNQWLELLENAPLVENLRLVDLDYTGHCKRYKLDWILPFPLAHLKLLEIIGGGQIFECNNKFVDNLMGCPKLTQLHLALDQKSTDEESLIRLANINIDLKIKIRISTYGDTAAIFDSSSRFKIVRIFHERMDSFVLNIYKWDSQISTALEDVVSTCSNLTKFGIILPRIGNNPIRFGIESEEGAKQVNAAMVQFFGTQERALKLKDLRLNGTFDEAVMSAVFRSCLNLVRLNLRQCPDIRDQHLVDWVSLGGGKLTHLAVTGCFNVTSEGIIPILFQSAERLLRCDLFNLGHVKDERCWEREMFNHCPNANVGFENY